MKCEFADCNNEAVYKVYWKRIFSSIDNNQHNDNFAGYVCKKHFLEWEKGDVPIYNEEGYSNEDITNKDEKFIEKKQEEKMNEITKDTLIRHLEICWSGFLEDHQKSYLVIRHLIENVAEIENPKEEK